MLKIENIHKSFPGVKALEDVSIHFAKGTIHAICGENGAGKSTLMNIISGNLRPDKGSIYVDDKPIVLSNYPEAVELGIGIVYQERSLVENLTVAENIFPELKPTRLRFFIDYKSLHKKASAELARVNLQGVTPTTIVSSLSAAQQQMIEIAKALALNPRILILDEPTASITSEETELLFSIIRELRDKGSIIIYISHRMQEIKKIADRISVLKDGKLVITSDAKDLSIEDIIRLMVGRELHASNYFSTAEEKTILSVEQLSGKKFSNVNFKIKAGEIFGLSGLIGAGRTELAMALAGATNYSGVIKLDGSILDIKQPADSLRNKVGYIPEERKKSAIFSQLSVEENISVSSLNSNARNGWIKHRKILNKVAGMIDFMNIRTPSLWQQAGKLSGGNQQKLVLARVLLTRPKLLIADEPTHGVDVGAKQEIYELLKKLASEGMSILLISSELPELLMLSDRIGVMRNGRMSAIFERNDATEEVLLRSATAV